MIVGFVIYNYTNGCLKPSQDIKENYICSAVSEILRYRFIKLLIYIIGYSLSLEKAGLSGPWVGGVLQARRTGEDIFQEGGEDNG